MKNGIVIGILFLAIAGCIPAPIEPLNMTKNAHTLSGTSWKMAYFETTKGAHIPPAPHEAYSIDFNADGSALWQLACNRGMNQWAIAENTRDLTFTPLATTRMACGHTILENGIVQAIRLSANIEQTPSELRMIFDQHEGVYVWTPQNGGN